MGEGTEDEFYEISAVSRLTGLSTHVLRVWERRYGVVKPERTDTKRRRYDRDDIQRLTLLKSLVDHGHTISSIAHLEIPALEERLSSVLSNHGKSAENAEPDADAQSCRIALCACEARNAIRKAADQTPELRVVAESSTIAEMKEVVRPGTVDLLIIEVGSLFPEVTDEIRETVEILHARRAIVIYRFASDKVVEPGIIERVTPLRAPVEVSEILLACTAEIFQFRRRKSPDRNPPVQDDSPVPARKYTSENLIALTSHSPSIQCECPRHLAQLLESLNAFEDYSRQCENRNEDDATLHAYLHQSTAKCRSEMEEVLANLLKAEGIDPEEL